MRFADIKTPIIREYDRDSHILVIDDDEALLKFFKIHLNKFFSKVIVVESAEEALKVLKEKTIDLVISDIKMPEMDGIQLLQKVRKQYAKLPVYMISGGLLEAKQEALIKKLAIGLLKKPFTVEEIQTLIDDGIKARKKLMAVKEKPTQNIKSNKAKKLKKAS